MNGSLLEYKIYCHLNELIFERKLKIGHLVLSRDELSAGWYINIWLINDTQNNIETLGRVFISYAQMMVYNTMGSDYAAISMAEYVAAQLFVNSNDVLKDML